MSLDNKRHYP